jgi:adenine-specific DNA-methyltransferase
VKEDKMNNPIDNVQSQDWNQERLAQLKQLMPDLFTNDGKLNINDLKQMLDPESLKETERYEFRWFGKSKAKREAFTPTDATLVFDEERSLNPEQSENLIIEGENLQVLKLLSKSYREQIKCIYIDPPYNTGKDFVYSDNFDQDKKEYWEDAEMVENGVKIDTNVESDGRYHSNWLNMMYSRLLIARQLLKEDGIIFISIDDNEVHHLRKLCDDVFGDENFVGIFCWKNKYGAGAKTRGFIEVHEYIMCYSKTKIQNIEAQLTDEQIKEFEKKKDSKYSSRGGFITQPLMTKSMDDRDNLKYTISYDGDVIKPRKQWVWEESRLLKAIENDEVVFKKKKNGEYSVRNKVYLKDENGNVRKGKPISVLNGPFNQQGTKEVAELIGEDIFSFPKPTALLDYLFSFSINSTDLNDEIFLDFFSGSGTTGHSLIGLNQKDRSNRKFILIQVPETTDEKSEAYKSGYKKISDITIERNKRVINNIIEEKKKAQPDLFSGKEDEQEQLNGLGFKVFKLQKSNFPRTEFAPDPELTEEENIESLKKYINDKEAQLVTAFNRDELITEILLKNGFKLNYTVTKQEQFKKNEIVLASDGEKETLLCLDVTIADETVEYFKSNTSQKLIVLERALDTTMKWNLKHYLGEKFIAF